MLDTGHLSKQPDWSHDETDSGAWPAGQGQLVESGVGLSRTIGR